MGVSALIWLALDGLGHPLDAPQGSVWEQELPTLGPLIDAGLALDATLGVAGLPQSGTGQTCWLTGQDAVRVMGEHFGPHAGPTLQKLLNAEALPVRLQAAGARAALVNLYAPEYFAAASGRRNRMGCFPFAFRAAGLPLNPAGVPLLRASLGLHYQAPWEPFLTPDEVKACGAALAKTAADWDLLVADLWFSDVLGHLGRPDPDPAVVQGGRAYMRRLDALVLGLLDGGARVVVSSDHGNFENLQVKSHTLARVPFAGSGVALGQPTDVVQAARVVRGWFGL